MRNVKILMVLMAIVIAASCEKDLEIPEWKEVSIIYAVINIKDTAQYLRINRMYTSPFEDPLNYTQVNDSVNYPQELFDVFLEEYKDGEMVGDGIQYYAVDREKEPGLFSTESNCVFKTRTEINEDSEYKLRVVNKESGHEVTGDCNVLGGVTVEESFLWERAYFRVNYYAEPLPDYEGSLDPYDHDHYIVRFLYWETKNGETYHKYVDWLPTFNPLKSVADDDTVYQLFDAYWEYLAENIEVDPNVKRRARGVDYMLALPGKELQNYIVVQNEPTNPHFYPEYSNLSDGSGVFGSKYFYTYFGLKLKKRTVDTISWGVHLVNHRFSDSNGEWH
jgi:hypothetical protein